MWLSLFHVEFVRRWSLHILPKGFTKSRAYGGFSCTKRRDYLDRCRELLAECDKHLDLDPEDECRPVNLIGDTDTTDEPTRCCPHCDQPMECIFTKPRPSWRELLADHSTCPLWYQPWPVTHRIRGPT